MHNQSSNGGIVCFGEILWDILPSVRLPGGAPMNVAYHLHVLGLSPTLITRIGRDEDGAQLMSLLKRKNINTSLVQLDPDTHTGLVHARPNERMEMTYEFLQPSAWDHIELTDECTSAVAQSSWFVFGSLAARGSISRHTLFSLLEMAKGKVLDINLRKPFFDQKLVEDLLQRADIVKMNESELELIAGWYGSYGAMVDQAKVVADKYKLSNLIVTLGANGAFALLDGKEFHHPGYTVKVADTIGSGDSFLAAFLSGIILQRSPEDIIQYASALGALVASLPGGMPEYDPADIERIISP